MFWNVNMQLSRQTVQRSEKAWLREYAYIWLSINIWIFCHSVCDITDSSSSGAVHPADKCSLDPAFDKCAASPTARICLFCQTATDNLQSSPQLLSLELWGRNHAAHIQIFYTWFSLFIYFFLLHGEVGYLLIAKITTFAGRVQELLPTSYKIDR